jgi:fibronectin type 3 domain-containing protein
MKSWVRFFVLGVMSVSFILSGCGGGGGDSEPPVPTVPGAPSGVTAVAGPLQVRISWDNVTGATSYNIYHSTTSPVSKATGTKVAGVTSPSVVTPLVNGTTYYFVVTAVNDIGESVESVQKSAIPLPNPPPAAPTSVSADAGPSRATISWNNVTGATSYNIYHSTTSPVSKATGTKVAGVTSPSVVTPLVNGTTYYFVVTAVNADGESADSSQTSAVPTANPPPAPPTGAAATAGPGQVTISWNGGRNLVPNLLFLDVPVSKRRN